MNHHRLLVTISISLLMSSALPAQVFPNNEGFDRFGGYRNITGTANGRFHLEMIDDRHFLVTPEGHGFIAIGVTHTGGLSRPKESRRDYFRESLHGDWEIANREILKIFRTCGYNSLGYDSHASTQQLLPFFGSCRASGPVSSWMRKQVKFPDVFGETWKEAARNQIRWMIKNAGDNPNLIGLYWTDMPAWDLNHARRALGKTWVDAIRELPEDAPGRIRYEQFVRENGDDASDEDFLVIIAREVYSCLGPLTRELAPNTLIFGERYAGFALPWNVIQEALPWIDVVSVQPGGSEFPSDTFDRLYRETNKPIMICDHQSSFKTPAHSNVMWSTLADVDSVGRAHAAYLKKGFSKPYLIGYDRCQYIDRYQADQQILKQGLLQEDGKPYPELIDSVKTNNWQLHQRFLDEGAAP